MNHLQANKYLEMLVFITIVEQKSFVAAAHKLNVSKQAVSRYLQALEQRLHTRLLHRTTRKLSLTTEGSYFYKQSKSILERLLEVEENLHPQQHEAIGLIKINAPLSFGMKHLAPLWQDFLTTYPKIKLHVNLSDQQVDILDEGVDLIIRIGELVNSALICRKLASTRILLCASPNYLQQYGIPQHPKDLMYHKIIAYSHQTTKVCWAFYDNQRTYNITLTPIFWCNNGDSCRTMILQHAGISLQPDFIVGEDIKNGQLIRLLPHYQIADFGIYAIYPSRKQLPLRLRCLLDFLSQRLNHHINT